MTRPTHQNPVALMTGAGSGIGRATAVMLARQGWSLGLVGRSRERLRETAGLCELCAGSRVELLDIDLAADGAAEGAIAWVDAAFGRLDALVNNAGVGELCPIAKTTRDLLGRTFAVNLFAPAMLIARAWPLLQHPKPGLAREVGPAIVNVSSMATIDPFPGLFAYAASKAALESLVRSIRNEAGESGIRAFAVAPGAVETPLLRAVFDESTISRERTLHPDEVARVIVECILGLREADAGGAIVLPSR